MINKIKALLGFKPSLSYSALIEQGAIIVDVRSKAEYSSGHIKSSKNIPVESLQNNLNKLPNKNTPIITCCASGMRSGMAKNILKSKGYAMVKNGGSWMSLAKKI